MSVNESSTGMLLWSAVSAVVCWRGFGSELDGLGSWIRLFSIQLIYFPPFFLFAFSSSFKLSSFRAHVSRCTLHSCDNNPSYPPAVVINTT